MGWLLPYAESELHSRLPVDEIMRRLAMTIKPPISTLSFDTVEDDDFHGTITDNHFVMERAPSFSFGQRQVFFPLTSGAVSSFGQGSAIGVKMRLRNVMESVLAAMVVLAIAMGIFVSFFVGLVAGLFLIALVLVSIGYGFYFHFHPEAQNTKEFLCETLEAEEAGD